MSDSHDAEPLVLALEGRCRQRGSGGRGKVVSHGRGQDSDVVPKASRRHGEMMNVLLYPAERRVVVLRDDSDLHRPRAILGPGLSGRDGCDGARPLTSQGCCSGQQIEDGDDHSELSVTHEKGGVLECATDHAADEVPGECPVGVGGVSEGSREQ